MLNSEDIISSFLNWINSTRFSFIWTTEFIQNQKEYNVLSDIIKVNELNESELLICKYIYFTKYNSGSI